MGDGHRGSARLDVRPEDGQSFADADAGSRPHGFHEVGNVQPDLPARPE
jgi:hypothetical protein